MHFDDDLEMYVSEIDGIIFACEDEPTVDYEESLQDVAKKYWSNLDYIIEFLMPDLQEVYGDIDTEMVKAKLGRPTVDFDNGRVDYCEQSFDDMHIFSFEFLDDEVSPRRSLILLYTLYHTKAKCLQSSLRTGPTSTN